MQKKLKTLTKVKAFFVDLDGTLIDSMSILRTCFFNFLQSYEKTCSVADFYSISGKPLDETVSIIKKKFKIDTPLNELISTYKENILSIYSRSNLFDDVIPFITKAKSYDIKLYLFTASSLHSALHILKKHTLNHVFLDFFTPDTLKLCKKSNNFVKKALEITQLNPSEVLIIDDSPYMVYFSKNCGVKMLLIDRTKAFFPTPSIKTLLKTFEFIF